MIFDFRFVICNLVLVASIARVADAETMLRWKFAEGQQLQVDVDQHTVTATTGAGKPTGIDITMQMRMSWTVDSVDADGTAQITQRFERFAVTMKSGTAEAIEYASDAETKPTASAADIATAVAPVIGTDFTVNMTNRGAIRAVKLSEAAEQAFAAVEAPGLKQLFSKDGITQLLGQAAVELPDQAIAENGDWQATFTTPSPLGTLKQSRTYTLGAPEDVDGNSLAQITVAGQLEIEASDQVASKLKLLDQSLTGSMLFDTEAGRLASSQSTQKFITERPYREFKIRVETTATTTTKISSQ